MNRKNNEKTKSDIYVRRWFGLALRIAVLTAIVLVVIWKYRELTGIDVRAVVSKAANPFAAVGTVLGIYLVKGLVFVIPASILYTAIGVAFPTVAAVFINIAGILLEITVTYLLGRMLGGSYVTRLLENKKGGARILALKDKKSKPFILLVRFLPAFPIDFVSLIFGAANMRFGPYFLLSAGGILPRVIFFTILGDKFYDFIPRKVMIMLVILGLIGALVAWVVRYIISMNREAQMRANRRYCPLKISGRDVILDTDIGPDCDDAGAIAVLAKYIKKYNLNLLGIVNCTSNPYGNGAIRVLSEFCGIPTRIAQYNGRKRIHPDDNTYNKHITEKYLEGRDDAVKAEKAEDFYREVLKKAKDNSVVIITTGFFSNIAEVMEDEPELFSKKVNALVCMAGKVPHGKEFNITEDIPSARRVLDNFKGVMVFSPYGLGEKVVTGFTEAPANAERNPLYDSYVFYNRGKEPQRMSWDLTAVHYAFEGDNEFYKTSRPVSVTVDDKGETAFEPLRGSNRYYISEKSKKNELRDYLNLILRGYDNE